MAGDGLDTRPFRERPERHVVGEILGPRAAVVNRSPRGERGRYCVWRYREDGSFDRVTCHLTMRGARKAARHYEQTGLVKGREA